MAPIYVLLLQLVWIRMQSHSTDNMQPTMGICLDFLRNMIGTDLHSAILPLDIQKDAMLHS
jgi:hypothetical protein